MCWYQHRCTSTDTSTGHTYMCRRASTAKLAGKRVRLFSPERAHRFVLPSKCEAAEQGALPRSVQRSDGGSNAHNRLFQLSKHPPTNPYRPPGTLALSLWPSALLEDSYIFFAFRILRDPQSLRPHKHTKSLPITSERSTRGVDLSPVNVPATALIY